MPIIQIRLSTRPDPVLSQRIAERISAITAAELGKDPALTAIAIDHVDPAHWFVGGKPLAAGGGTSYFLDIRITDETNTRAEKARYLAAVHRAMTELLPRVEEESYVHVNDARAEAYGYGGRSQAARHHRPG